MAINERLIDTEVAAAGNGGGGAEAEQGLILHLDANDVDSYDGDGAEWVDISTFEKTIPISDNADSLEFYLNASDSTSYGGSGTTWTDISGNSNDGTISGAVFDTDNGGYFDFDGVNDEVNWSTFPTAFESLTAITMELWVKFDTVSGTQYPIWLGRAASGKSVNIGLVGGKIQTWVGVNGYPSLFTPVANKWYHLAVTISGSTQAVYVDGEDYTNNSSTSGISMDSNAANVFLLGDYSGGTADFNGQIGQVRIYSSALSASDIGQNYRHGRDTVYTDLIPDTDLALHFDAADLTSAANTTWTDKAASLALTKSGTVGYDDELGDFIDFGGGYYGNDNNLNTSIKDSNGDFTIEFWYNFDAFSGNNSPIGIMQTASLRGLWIYFDGSTMDVYNYKSGTHSASQFTSQTFSTLGLSVGEWCHITHVIDASTDIKTYVNGELKATSTNNAGGTHWTSMYGIRIGDMQTLPYSNDGKMGQFRIYSSALTQDQIYQNYNFTKPSYPNGYDGTINGATWNALGYFDFDGTTGKIDLPLTTLGSSSFSISMWLNFDSVGSGSTQQYIFTKYKGSASGTYGMLCQKAANQDTISFTAYNTSNGVYGSANTTTAMTAGVWYNYVLVFDSGSTITAYLNSNLEATTSTSGTFAQNNAEVTVGAYYAGAAYLNGQISKVKVYDKPLTQAEITALYNEGE